MSYQQILNLDQKNDKKRQRQLYGHNLFYDPDRPIQQHPIILQNFTESQNEQVFKQFVKNTRQIYQDPKLNKMFEQYQKNEQDIQRLRRTNSYIPQLKTQEVDITIKKIRQQILQINAQLQKGSIQQYQLDGQLLRLKKQIQSMEEYVMRNQGLLKKMESKQLLYEKQQAIKLFKKEKDQVLSTTKGHLSTFESLYKSINEKVKKLQEKQKQIQNLKRQLLYLQDEKNLTLRQVLKQQAKCEQSEKQLMIQRQEWQIHKTKQIQKKQKSQKSEISQNYQMLNLMKKQQQIEIEQEQQDTAIQTTHNRVKYHIQLQQKDNSCWCLLALILCTILLILATIYKFSGQSS